MYPFCVDFLEMHMEMDRLIDPVKVAAAFALPCTQSRNLAPLSIYQI